MLQSERRDLIVPLYESIECAQSYLECNFTRQQLQSMRPPSVEIRREKAKISRYFKLVRKLESPART
jgi:hypothetical protein